MIKRYSYSLIISLFCLLLNQNLTAQSITANVTGWDSLSYLNTPYQQKIYLHFDKPYYAAGERMWFRAYLLNANTFVEDTTYTPMYVELINSQDSIIERKKIQCMAGSYSGSFELKELIPEGTYRVRAYTEWMQNSPKDFYYYRQFFIGNSLISQIKSEIKYTFQNKKKGMAEVRFLQNNAPFASKEITYSINRGQKRVKSHTEYTSTNGVIYLDYKLHKQKDKRPTISVSYRDSNNIYSRTYTVPRKNDFDVQMFPEGGDIIDGMTNTIAFKAIGVDGLGIDVKGVLYDNEDKKISDFKSLHLGMGRFSFYPDDTHRYYAVFKTKKGEYKKLELPSSKKEGYGLAGVQKFGRILINVKSVKGRMVNDSLSLLGHIRGKVFYHAPIEGFTPAVMFDSKELGPGIAHFVLLDKHNQPISERLVFIREQYYNYIKLDFYKPVNTKRDKVKCILEARDPKNQPIKNGTFSISITDASVVESDSTAEDIYSNFLLTTDLKGYIEKPNLYFNPNYENANEGLDLLLLTQGWTRFDISKALNNDNDLPAYDMEQSYEISGQINEEGNQDKPIEGVQVNAYAPNIDYFGSVTTGKDGFFFFKNLAFPKNTQFTLQARNNNEFIENLKIDIFQQDLPKAEESFFPAAGATPITDTYLFAARDKYFNENGTRSLISNRVGVLAYTPDKIELETMDPKFTYSDEEYVLEGKQLQEAATGNLAQLLKKIPSLEMWNENKYNQNDEKKHTEIIKGPRFSIDGNIYSYNEVKDIDVKELESVQVFDSFRDNGNKNSRDNQMIRFVFKEDNPIAEVADLQQMATNMPVGYSSNVLFYEPKYEYFSVREQPIPDTRTTISFIPDVRTGETGKGIFSFYMADKLVPYNIVVEGVTADGKPCRLETKRMLFYKDAQHSVKR